MMKNMRTRSFALLAIIALIISSCKPEEYVAGEPFSSLEGIDHTWVIDQVFQRDNLTSKTEKTLDVTSLFSGATPLKITFNSDDYTFSVDPGDGPNYIGTGGSWAFDDEEFPSMITLDENGTQTVLTMNAPVRPGVDPYLDITLDRPLCNGENGVSYNYIFVREN